MIFSEFYKSPRSPLAKLRHGHPQLTHESPTETPQWVAEEYADLLSKDKAKQKEAVKRYLEDKVKTDWVFLWPAPPTSDASGETVPNSHVAENGTAPKDTQEITPEEPRPVQDETRDDDGYQVDASDSDEHALEDENEDAQSIYSVVSEDGLHYRPRAEWSSDLSDDEAPTPSPFRFDSPDAVGSAVEATVQAKKSLRRKAVREEMAWNEGLACFEARRNAWTGARTVRVRSKPVSPPIVSPRSPRRFFFRRSMSGSPPNNVLQPSPLAVEGSGGASDASSLAKDNDKELNKQTTKDSSILGPQDSKLWPVETLLPIGQPLLPPNNSLRASIAPPVYLNLYDKVILHNLQPSCPINLSDMLRSCVAGWKRDGEWPPRATAPDPSVAMRRKKKNATSATASEGTSNTPRRLSLGILNREKDDESRSGKGIRRSLQRALGLGATPGTPESPAAEKPKEG